MEYAQFQRVRFSRMAGTAALSVVALIVSAGWSVYSAIATTNKNLDVVVATVRPSSGSESTDPATLSESGVDPTGFGLVTGDTTRDVAHLGPSVVGQLAADYSALQSRGLYTPEVGRKIAADMAAYVDADVPYRVYTTAEIKTDSDASSARTSRYRKELSAALVPLQKNKRLELDIYGMYIQTHDDAYLARLHTAAGNYRFAGERAGALTVPGAAVERHVALVNSLQEFAAVLDAMADNAEDPITSAALLRSYNRAEADVFASFDGIAKYYAQENS